MGEALGQRALAALTGPHRAARQKPPMRAPLTVKQALAALPPLVALAHELLKQRHLLDLLGVNLARRDALGAPPRRDVRQRVEADELRDVDRVSWVRCG